MVDAAAPVFRRFANLSPTAIILLFIAVLRLPYIGDAHIHVDESYYLLFAERWANGAMPYVDIWDRKPIGLFVIFRLAVLLGGTAEAAIIAYQLIALAVVAATALILAGIARAVRGDGAGLAAGLLYPAGLLALQGSGGQATIFTNLAVCGAAWLIFTVWRDRAVPAARLFLAMLVLGAALQIKYTAGFEAAVLGVAALCVLQGRGWAPARLVAAAAAMVAVGLVPSLAAVASFAAVGALGPYLFANFATIFTKVAASAADPVLSLLLLLPIVGLCLWRARPHRPGAGEWALITWAASALLAAFILGLASEHRLQSVLPPLVLLAAMRAGRAWGGQALAAALAVMITCGIIAKVIDIRSEGSPYISYAIADAIRAAPRPAAGSSCIYVVDTLPLLYALARACAPTAYAFPTQLTHPSEIASIGIDARAELARVLASRPRMIVIRSPRQDYIDARALTMIEAALAQHYRLVRRFGFATGEYQLYAARP